MAVCGARGCGVCAACVPFNLCNTSVPSVESSRLEHAASTRSHRGQQRRKRGAKRASVRTAASERASAHLPQHRVVGGSCAQCTFIYMQHATGVQSSPKPPHTCGNHWEYGAVGTFLHPPAARPQRYSAATYWPPNAGRDAMPKASDTIQGPSVALPMPPPSAPTHHHRCCASPHARHTTTPLLVAPTVLGSQVPVGRPPDPAARVRAQPTLLAAAHVHTLLTIGGQRCRPTTQAASHTHAHTPATTG